MTQPRINPIKNRLILDNLSTFKDKKIEITLCDLPLTLTFTDEPVKEDPLPSDLEGTRRYDVELPLEAHHKEYLENHLKEWFKVKEGSTENLFKDQGIKAAWLGLIVEDLGDVVSIDAHSFRFMNDMMPRSMGLDFVLEKIDLNDTNLGRVVVIEEEPEVQFLGPVPDDVPEPLPIEEDDVEAPLDAPSATPEPPLPDFRNAASFSSDLSQFEFKEPEEVKVKESPSFDLTKLVKLNLEDDTETIGAANVAIEKQLSELK